MSTPRCPAGSTEAWATPCRSPSEEPPPPPSLLPGPSLGWGPSALQGPDDREALLNACAASQCGWQHLNKVTVSGSCLPCSLWLGSGAHTRYDAGEAAPLGLQGTWGCKGRAGGVTQGLCRTLPGQAGQLGRGPCSGERCQLGRALSVVLGVDGTIRLSGQAQLQDDAGPPTLQPPGYL